MGLNTYHLRLLLLTLSRVINTVARTNVKMKLVVPNPSLAQHKRIVPYSEHVKPMKILSKRLMDILSGAALRTRHLLHQLRASVDFNIDAIVEFYGTTGATSVIETRFLPLRTHVSAMLNTWSGKHGGNRLS